MSLYTEIQQAIEDVAKKHGEADELPQTLDELKACTPTIQSEFRRALEAVADERRSGQW